MAKKKKIKAATTTRPKRKKVEAASKSKKYAKAGQPRKYQTVEHMKKAITEYFESGDKITICGLALALGFSTRQSLLDYEGYDKGKFLDTLKRAKLFVEAGYEGNLCEGHAGGSIFALKNFGWEDQQKQVHDISDRMDRLLGRLAGNTRGLPKDD